MKRQLAEEPVEQEEPRSLWTRIKEAFFGREELDTEVDVAAQPSLRLHTVHSPTINIRHHVGGADDARAAAESLKHGAYQIVNVESATPQLAQQAIDFLNGACYALDGKVERLGENIYMFVPCNVTIAVDNESALTNAARRSTGDTGQASM